MLATGFNIHSRLTAACRDYGIVEDDRRSSPPGLFLSPRTNVYSVKYSNRATFS